MILTTIARPRSSLARWLMRLAIVSVPVGAVLASCGGSETGDLFQTGTGGAAGRGTDTAGSSGGSSTGGSSSSSSAAGGSSGASGSGATGGSSGAGGSTSGSTGGGGASTTTGTAGSTAAGGRGAGGGTGGKATGGSAGSSGGAGQGGTGGVRDAGQDGPCISGEGGPCGGFIANACKCADGLECRSRPIPDAPGVCTKPDAGLPHNCVAACNRCVGGVCCGTACCRPGEWCDESSGTPTCKCGTHDACTMPNTCQPFGPASENGCGSICCFNNCPQ